MKTQAFQLVQKGNPEQAFKLKEIELSSLKEDEILIEVEAFGLNYADVMARNGLYKEAPEMPCVIGYEVVGVITEVGTKVNTSEIGKRVVAFCRFGAYAKHVITTDLAYAEIGDLATGKALSLATQYVTAYYMSSYLSPIYEGEKALIHAAAGGVGTALIQLLQLRGADIYAKTRNESKKAYLEALGVKNILFYEKEDYVISAKKILGNDRFDVTYNPVAGSTFKKDFELIGSGGRVILFGGSERSGKKWGILSTLNFVRKMGLTIPIGLMMRSKNILGVNMLKIADNKPLVLNRCLKAVVALAKENKIDPKIGGEFTSSELAKAHSLLESGKSVGKIFVRWQ